MGINCLQSLSLKTISLKEIKIVLDNLNIYKKVSTVILNKIELYTDNKDDISKSIWKYLIKPNLVILKELWIHNYSSYM